MVSVVYLVGTGEYSRLPKPRPTFGIFRLDALRSRRRRTATGTAIRSIRQFRLTWDALPWGAFACLDIPGLAECSL